MSPQRAPTRGSPAGRRGRSALPLLGYAATATAFRNAPGRRERAIFTHVNEGPDWRVFRVPQQLGTPWVLPGLSIALLLSGRRHEAIAAAAALPVVKGLEVATKKTLRRPRPLYTSPTVLRDDAPVEGPSFPSGHTAIATCTTLLAARHLPRPAGLGPGGVLLASAYVRVHQGAHHPSDTVGGFFLGWAVAELLRPT